MKKIWINRKNSLVVHIAFRHQIELREQSNHDYMNN